MAGPHGGPGSHGRPGPQRPGDEPVEVVDRDGSVLDVVSRREMRAGRLRHRCTYVVLVAAEPEAEPRLDPDDRIVVHQRADWKDTYPSYWDLAFGGVCGVGEPWTASARRELAEEAGVHGVELEDLGPGRFEDDDNAVVGRVFLARWSGPLRFDDGEVVAADRVRIADLEHWMTDRPVCADTAAIVVPLLLARSSAPR